MPPLAALEDEPRPVQGLQMEGERGGHEADALCDHPGRQPPRTTLDQQAIGFQAMFVGECSERIDYLGSLHVSYGNTTIVEMSIDAQMVWTVEQFGHAQAGIYSETLSGPMRSNAPNRLTPMQFVLAFGAVSDQVLHSSRMSDG